MGSWPFPALSQSIAPKPELDPVIRVFPAWPAAWDAKYKLLAKGGFVVSSSMASQDIQYVEIESSLGGSAKVRNPWATSVVLYRNGVQAETLSGSLLSFATTAGETIVMVRPGTTPDQYRSSSVVGSGATGPITSGIAGKCADNFGNSSNPNTAKVNIYNCNGSTAQQWTVAGDGTLRINGLCMDVVGGVADHNKPVGLWTCHGGANQQWTQQANGSLKSGLTTATYPQGLCLDAPGGNPPNGTQLIIWECNGGTNQKWDLP